MSCTGRRSISNAACTTSRSARTPPGLTTSPLRRPSFWVTSAFARLVADRSERADGSFDPGRPDSVARLRSLAGATVQQSLLDACAPSWSAFSFSSIFGDRGETGDREVRSPYLTVGSSPTERGRNLLMRALADTGDERQIRVDEFEVVRLDNGKYVVVLPGVTDLSSPDLGWNADHRSARDLDQGAFGSSRSTSVDHNPYAGLVREGLTTAGVLAGADLLLVGHSYGADTALDLAADPGFNGPDGYRVTHVVAAAYHSGPQLRHVPASTDVLVLQNHRDVAVIVEAVGDAHVTDALVDRGEALADLAERSTWSALPRTWPRRSGTTSARCRRARRTRVRTSTPSARPWPASHAPTCG